MTIELRKRSLRRLPALANLLLLLTKFLPVAFLRTFAHSDGEKRLGGSNRCSAQEKVDVESWAIRVYFRQY